MNFDIEPVGAFDRNATAFTITRVERAAGVEEENEYSAKHPVRHPAPSDRISRHLKDLGEELESDE